MEFGGLPADGLDVDVAASGAAVVGVEPPEQPTADTATSITPVQVKRMGIRMAFSKVQARFDYRARGKAIRRR